MRKPKRVIFWQNELSIHQSATIRAFSEQHPDCEVIWVAERGVSAERQALGWSVQEAGRARILIAPDAADVARLVAQSPEESVHLCSGISAFPLVYEAFKACLQTDALLGIVSEASDFRGHMGVVRRVLWYWNALRYRKRIDLIVATGALGERWFVKSGFPARKVFPYGYFTQTPEIAAPSPDPGAFKLLYVGRFIHLKGLDLLLRALAQCQSYDWQFVAIGQGDQQPRLNQLAQQLGIAERIQWLPPIPNDQVPAEIGTADALVLPSRYDGWGAVVNEALLCGVPVICSNHCGASDLVGEDWRGKVFQAYSIKDLVRALQQQFIQGKRTPAQTLRLQEWTHNIHAETAADYLYKVILAAATHTQRPVVPWRQNFRQTVMEDNVPSH